MEEERVEITPRFDVMFWELKEIGVLHWGGRILKDIKKINIREKAIKSKQQGDIGRIG